MDFDNRFNFEEFKEHFQDLHLVDSDKDAYELTLRTTETTRGGEAFSFKPTHMWIGSGTSTRFYSGFDCEIETKGLDPQKENSAKLSEQQIPSSFWVRFNSAGDRFQFRVFCGGQSISALRPYEAILPFKDVIPGGVELRARKDGARVLAHLTIRSRRPPRATVRLVPVIPRRDPIYDRVATEADFFHSQECNDSNEAEAGEISPLGNEKAIVKIGLWLMHRFSFDTTIRQYKLIWQCMIRLRLIQLEPDLHASRYLPPPHGIESSWPAEFSNFQIRYLVEGLISYGIISVAELGSLCSILRRYDSRRWPLILEGFFKTQRKGNIRNDVKYVIERITRPLPPYCMLVRRCLVTPTRCLVQPPQLEISNSMLRAFAHYQDQFLRVQFEDEDEALQITSEILDVDEEMHFQKGIFARLRRAVRFGLRIGGRKYVFLCFGESQVRERGCWMISETADFTVRKVLDWIGDLSEERNIAKHAARQGLVLSTSRPVDLNDLQIKVQYDLADIVVTTSGSTYTFTDGAGQCGQELVNRCSSTLGRDWRRATPSAVQVRVGGGSKGVLCVVPDIMIEENLLKVRKSMIKFKSNSNSTLNVLKVASYGIAYLNRQVILLLEEQGVPSQILLQLFLEEKGRVEGLEQEFKSNYLASLTTFPLTQAIELGFTEDPLVQNIIRVLKCRLLGDLKWKARIPIEKGAYLMGVADETRTLNEGEIFCQIESPSGRQVITGPCTIYRNPCLHPGDVRRVQAVENPSLSYLKNVIVFSTWGTRDLPSMMGGGDLDGDHYTLLWDERLLIPRVHEPMDYTPPPPKTVSSWKTVTIDDTKEFWLEYLKNDILGMICNAHLALADRYSPSTVDCLRMAQLASQAVDFSKTGVPVDRASYIPPESYPDFMGKDRMPKTYQSEKKKPLRTHRSEKVLGTMFRSIDPDPVFEPIEEGIDWDPPFTVPAPKYWEHYLEDAAALKTRYDFELNGLLRTHAICEAECVAGVLLRSRKRRIRIDRDHSLRETVRDAYDELASFFTSEASSLQLRNSHPVMNDPREDRRGWAFACYKITYDKSYSRNLDHFLTQSTGSQIDDDFDGTGDGIDSTFDEEEDGGALQLSEKVVEENYYSFPWLFYEDLLDLAGGGV